MLVMEEDKAASGSDQHCRLGIALSVVLGLAWAHCACAAPRHFDLPAGDARKMLNLFCTQAELQLLYDYHQLDGKKTNAVVGDYEPTDALNKMVAGLPVNWTLVNSHTLALTLTADKGASRRHWWQRLAARPAVQTDAGGTLEQVLVAGSYSLNQAPPVGAALIRLDRIDIEQSGLATAQDFLHTLPQVFGGGPSEDTQLGREALTNATKGSGVNLRGLDAGATLVLINGQRTAPSGTEGLFSDISWIPLSAIDHIDVLPDGASAQYGADAIGGIVNFVLRSDFSGAQTQLRDGDFNGNPLGGRTFSQLLGGRFGSTTAMMGFELYERGALPASDRLQATSNLTPFGGTNFDQLYGVPGTLFAGGQTFAIPAGGIARGATPQLTPGTENLYDEWSGADVVPDEKRWSVFGTLRAEVSDALELSGDALFTRRETSELPTAGVPLNLPVLPGNPFYFNPTAVPGPAVVTAGTQGYFGPPYSQDNVDTGTVGVGLSWKMSDSWNLHARTGYAFENEYTAEQGQFDSTALAAALTDSNPATALDPFSGSAGNNPATLAAIDRTRHFNSRSNLKILGLSAGGSLFRAPGGEALLSMGVEYRDQHFATAAWDVAPDSATLPLPVPARADLSRTVRAEFAELRVPLVGPENARPLLHAFEISAGGRVEDYSDVGRSGVPKIGLLWSPTADVSVRSTFTRSFRPPSLSDLATGDSNSEIVPVPDARSPTGVTNALIAFGNNPNLQDERARTWTLGAQFAPATDPDLSVALTYFDTYYADRIDFAELPFNVLNQPEFAWLVNRSFTDAQRAAICSQTAFEGVASSCVNAPIGVLIDNRLRNIEYLETRGFDLIAKYGIATPVGRFDWGLNGTYLLGYKEQKTPDSPLQQLLNTQNNPINLRFRGSLSWQRAGLGASLFVNYDNGYRDLLSEPARNVRSFTTFDLQVRYAIRGESARLLANTEIAFTAQNLFNSSPPFLNNPLGIGYDEENADLLGRILSVDIRKRW